MGQAPKKFKRNILASAIAASVVAVGGANAQGENEIEEVLVTGIRASVEASMDVKRESSGVVDAISSEDIGKFPDSNLAESLQRITGVSIDRRNGEGSRVTVRGFGPDFNIITLNGRMMPASSLDQNVSGGASSSSRGFDMDNLASEAISGVEVYKTGKANISGGGIGATINLKTTRPLDQEGFKVSVGGKLLNDTTNRIGDDITPEVSGLLSWSNETFGVSASLSHQERHSASTGAYVNQWSGNQSYTGTYPITISADDAGRNIEGPATQIENEPAIGQVVGNPSSLRWFHADHERTRTNGQLTFQFAPNDRITATLDYTRAEQEIFQNRTELSLWFQDFPRTDLVFDNEGSPTPVLFWEETRNTLVEGQPALDDDGNVITRPARDIGVALQQQNQKNKLESFGFNIEWDATDELSFAVDIHNSTSKSTPNADFGNWVNVGMGANVSLDQGADWTGDLPLMMINFNDGAEGGRGLNGNGILDNSDIGSAVHDLRRESAKTEITQIKLDGSFEFSDTGKIDFGIESRKMENLGREAQKQETLQGNWGISTPGDVPEGLLEEFDFAPLFDGYSMRSSNQAWFDSVSGGTARPLTVGVYGDAAAVGRALAPAGGRTFDITDVNATPDNTNRTIEESINAIYFQLDLESTLGDFPVGILAGARYETTDVTSTSLVVFPTITWQSNDDFLVVADPNGPRETISDEASYDHLLPSLDIKVDLRDDLVARFSTGKTIARANYNQLTTAWSFNSGGSSLPTLIPGSVPGGADGGNAGLLPLESNNFDISLEWYFADSSYASIGYFEKRVNNFIGVEPIRQPLFGVKDPSAGPRAQAALAQLEAEGVFIDATSLFSQVVANEQGENRTDRSTEYWEDFDVVAEDDDPEAIFSARVPRNINNAQIEGLEIAGQHFFGDTGFGLQANYTFVSGDVEFDVTEDPDNAQFALVGLSDTANLSLIYEKFGFSGRISYNWRDKFLNNAAINENEPEFTEAYSQIDMNLSYEVLDGLFVSFEAINITEEDQRRYGRSERQLTQMSVLGARYALGVRYSF